MSRSALNAVLRRAIQVALIGLALIPFVPAVAALSGHGHRWVDIFAQFTAPALTAAVLLALAMALLRQPVATGVAALGALLLLIAVWPQWFPPTGRPRKGAPVVTLYSANLWAWNEDVAAMRRSIQAADPDIIVLIEMGDAPATGMDTLLAGYPHRVASPRSTRRSGPARSLIASRYPLTALPRYRDDLADVSARADTPFGPLNVIGVHLTRPWPYQFQWGQILQVRALADLRRPMTGPVVVAGDFNSVSSARIGRQVQDEVGLIPAPGWPGTWHSKLPAPLRITIDQVYRSPDLAFVGRQLGQPTGSDHHPVVVRITPAA
ncbi:MAG: endonuclease [Brevundimonas sp.]|uniref:endonuclease/exonuclease/phosphatase family protein n=1 Tax=Brevundimonas sp. TaxID=1871086 RepID=UPI00122B67AB|nr:endonuclease/exonuclease/phosphatase family protein [Brevundimonas sp.]RZJ16774.1 MAG: endonuclease [Brevundimonas sp.]